MKTNEDNQRTFKNSLNLTRQVLSQAIKNHEAIEHNGAACYAERENAIAFLAHCLGLEPPNLDTIKATLDEYNRDCPYRHNDKGFHAE